MCIMMDFCEFLNEYAGQTKVERESFSCLTVFNVIFPQIHRKVYFLETPGYSTRDYNNTDGKHVNNLGG